MRWVPSGSMHKQWSRCGSWRLPSRPVSTFFLKNDAMGPIRVAPASRRDAVISSMSELGVGCCFFDCLAALA
ncbi:hypothetical protein Y032_0074g859 [Ancylostoma ceylanicum]|uniref:Uncharacterized protein n=1 Tax=Ancylostoma ceylanicum TaxID=53326 RepID=A0A016TVE2_9BILA|nr:hypothetical protein Y032_0074g859 [Ancylostoma ceylanicum]